MRKLIKRETITRASSEILEEPMHLDTITKKQQNSMRIILRNSIDQTSSLISLNYASSSKDSKEESNFLSAKSSHKKMDLPNVSSKTYKPIYSSISST